MSNVLSNVQSNVSAGDDYRRQSSFAGIPPSHTGPRQIDKNTINPQSFYMSNKDYGQGNVLSSGKNTFGSGFGGAATPANPMGS